MWLHDNQSKVSSKQVRTYPNFWLLELYRAHTQHALQSAASTSTYTNNGLWPMAFSIEMIWELQYVLIWRSLPGKLCAWAENIWPAVGTVSRCGYNGRQKATICDAHGTIRRTPKWVSTYSLNLQVAQMSKCWDLAILVQTTDDRWQTNQLFYSYRW